jgi:chemotaxis signal transduction protein
MNARLDWRLVNARLALAEQAMERALQPSPERIAKAYRERALHLATAPACRLAASGEPVIVFQLGEARYSIGLEHVAEVIPLPAVTPVPGAPKHIAGVISVRGEIRPLMDLKALLGIPGEAANPGYGLLLNKPSPGLGLQVDVLEGVSHFAREDAELVDISRYVTGRTAGAGMLLSVDAVLGALIDALEGRLSS